MDDIFTILKSDQEGDDQGTALRIGLDIRIGGREVQWPLTGACFSREDLIREIDAAKDALDRVFEQGERLFGAVTGDNASEISSDMPAEEIWNMLNAIEGDAEFIASFNALDIERRRSVAEHVLTRCNVFSGRAAVFSARFDSDSGLIG